MTIFESVNALFGNNFMFSQKIILTMVCYFVVKLGQGDTQQQTRPVYITELSDKKCIAVMCGHYHSMALSADHRVWSWGWGVHGQLGVGSIEDALLPTHVQTLDEYQVTALAAGYSHSAVLTAQVGFGFLK